MQSQVKKQGPKTGENRRPLSEGVLRLISNGNEIRAKHFYSYAESKRTVNAWVADCKKIVENPNNITYIEITKY